MRTSLEVDMSSVRKFTHLGGSIPHTRNSIQWAIDTETGKLIQNTDTTPHQQP